MPNDKVIYIDVDDTLIRSVGKTRIPMPESVALVRRAYDSGHRLYCWSRGGSNYAEEVARELGIAECFVDFLPKPDSILDVRRADVFDYCEIILPANAANHYISELD